MSMTTAAAAPASATTRVFRVEIRKADHVGNPRAADLLREAQHAGLPATQAQVARVYLIEAPLSDDQSATIVRTVLTDPVSEIAYIGATEPLAGVSVIEVHPQPGVMDPAAQTVAEAISDLIGIQPAVQTGWRYELRGVDQADAQRLASRLLANTVIHHLHTGAFWPDRLPAGHSTQAVVVTVPIRDLDDAALTKLSRDGHLFLDLAEMQAIRSYYQTLGREPNEIELETLAQTWSEHCVHKTLKSTIHYQSNITGTGHEDPLDWNNRPGHELHEDGSITIHNLLKSTVAAATHELIAEGIDWCLSVFDDNSGVIALDDQHAVCIKVETHNHPSAIEPYGGAATGIGGCIRDIIGTGLGAKPIASTDVFCVAHPDMTDIPEGCLPPRRVLTEIVAGVRDYGNRMGIPTVNGAVWFDDRHIGNPLVYCGCIGLMPRDKIKGRAQPGDLIVAVGGRTGRDGIHGATFSSAELTDTHADEFGHAVQIGNALEEKRALDAILRARDHENGTLFNAITDCGAGGFSSAVGEMGEKLGATVQLEAAPLKYEGLTPTEIWISEAQERMVLAVPRANLHLIQDICNEEQTQLAVLGTFGTPNAELILRHEQLEVGRISMDFLHNGVPQPTRRATWSPRPEISSEAFIQRAAPRPSLNEALLALLAHPNIASKHWIIRQYDHEVQGNTVVRPLIGPSGRGPGDAAVIEPVPGSGRGIAIGCGLATGLEADPYLMALAAVDEAVRNVVCVGADPSRIAILDNFCWPSCSKPENLGSLVRAAEGCYDAAKAYKTPFVSGKDSLNNQFTTADGITIQIPPTLLITAMGIVPDLGVVTTSDAKRGGNILLLVGQTEAAGGGSHYERIFGAPSPRAVVDELLSNVGNRVDGLLDALPAETRNDLERLVDNASQRLPTTRLDAIRDKAWLRLSGLVGTDISERLERQLGQERLELIAARLIESVARKTNLHPGLPIVDLHTGPATAQAVHAAISAKLVASAHDCSEGGLLVAIAEMLIAGSTPQRPIGCQLLGELDGMSPAAYCFAETPSRYLLEVTSLQIKQAERLFKQAGVPCTQVGVLDHTGNLTCSRLGVDLPVQSLTNAWRGTLDW